MTGFIERFNPAVSKAKDFLDSGEIGELIISHSRRIGSWPERIGDVGVVEDTAIHDIDLTRYLFGEEPVEVYAKGGRRRHSRAEDHIQAILTLGESSKTAFIEANWLTPRKKREMEITGSDGVINIEFLAQRISIEKAEMITEPIMKWSEPLKLELKHFIECVAENKKPSPDALDGLKAILVAEAIIESIKSGKIIELNLKNL